MLFLLLELSASSQHASSHSLGHVQDSDFVLSEPKLEQGPSRISLVSESAGASLLQARVLDRAASPAP